MIDRTQKLIFIHIPKTGGSSIESYLIGSDEVGDHGKIDQDLLTAPEYRQFFPLARHATLRDYEKLLVSEGDDPKKYRVFALIRNPVEMLKSTYRFRLKNFAIRRKVMGTFQRLRFRLGHSFFSVFLLSLLVRKLFGMSNSESLTTYVASDFGLEAKVFRLEDVGNCPEPLFTWLGVPNAAEQELPHKNPTAQKQQLASILLKTTARRVFADMYAYYV